MMTFRKQKAEAFRVSVMDVIKSSPEVGITEAIAIAAKGPAPRFYCTYESARRFVSKIERGEPLKENMNENKLRMYRDLHERWREISGREVLPRQKYNSYTILESIIEEPAPSFYSDYETLRSLFYYYGNKCNNHGIQHR